jgi:hypothetical protein
MRIKDKKERFYISAAEASAPCTPNSDCAMSQGSWFNGDGKRGGSGGGLTAIRA